ncbi:hypothetical protein E2C01_049492 [Portunus trituberculatus]|uniref:Uncharacterized protein n=1 Tax=Portunus trituberculatus TaxID=210409 RepID=A0A5B7G9K8_PORTR|nr:hypothetical protein [Portunus trituberculatus]
MERLRQSGARFAVTGTEVSTGFMTPFTNIIEKTGDSQPPLHWCICIITRCCFPPLVESADWQN